MRKSTRVSNRCAFGRSFAALLAIAGLQSMGATSAEAAQQVFDVDETQSTFTSGSIDVEFTAVVHSTGIFGSQTTTGSATVTNVGYAADGSVILDVNTGQVTLQDLSISGNVNQSGTGTLSWANLFNFTIVYNIISQALDLNAPLTMALSGNTFSGTPNFEFSGVSDGQVSGLLVNYAISPQAFSSDGNLPISGVLTSQSGNTLLQLSGAQLVVDLGSSPTTTTVVNQCALRVLGLCVFFLTTADITIDSLVYNNVQMNLVGTAPGAGPVCGDGNLDAGEGCDDGNTIGGDGCSAVCQPEVCGNNVLDPGESCDDGNTIGGDGCSAACQPEVCGNNVLDPGESCDDGNTVGGDGCSAACQLEACGNGTLDPGEGCDDGNTASGDGCSAVCQPEVCGNSVLDPGEGCDDGNTASGDGCSAVCQPEVCGNGTLDPGEACDDGNTVDGDGCSSICELPPQVPALDAWGMVALTAALLAAGAWASRRRLSVG